MAIAPVLSALVDHIADGVREFRAFYAVEHDGGHRALSCLAFAAGLEIDCLRQAFEIGIEGRRAFLNAGGREFHLIPCLNESPEWIAALADICAGS